MPALKITVALFVLTVLLGGLDVVMGLSEFVFERPFPTWFKNAFHMGYEHNVPSLMSAAIAAWCAILLWKISMSDQGGKTFTWRLLAACFALLALDEAFAFHEKLPLLLNQVYPWLDEHIWRHCSDIAFIIPFCAGLLFIAIFFRFARSLPTRTRWLIYSSGLLFVTGAFFLEMAGFILFNAYWLLVPAEESMEMLGLILFSYALMEHRSANARHQTG